jgi:hypothetical protein
MQTYQAPTQMYQPPTMPPLVQVQEGYTLFDTTAAHPTPDFVSVYPDSSSGPTVKRIRISSPSCCI